MDITTRELIEVMKKNPMNEGRGRLYGRLDVLRKWHNEHHSYKSCGRRSHIDCENKRLDKFTCSIGREIKMIEDALKQEKVEWEKYIQ